MKCKYLFLLSLSLSLYSTIGKSAQLNLSQTPISLGNPIPPNVFFSLDDSGSMDWDILVKPYWDFCAYDPNATGTYSAISTCGSFVNVRNALIRSYGNGNFRYFYLLYKNNDDLYDNKCSSSSNNAMESCPEAATADWRVYSSDLNLTYYDPSLTYTPWLGACDSAGNLCQDASFTAARSNPVQTQVGYNNTRNLGAGGIGTQYDVWIDDRGFTGPRPLRAIGVNATDTGNDIMDLWDSHVTISFIGNQINVYKTTYAPNALGLQASKTLQANLTNTSACYNVLGPQELVQSIFDGTLSYTSTNAPGCRTIIEAQTNFANWYQYSRRRSLAARGAISHIVDRFPFFRYGMNVINNTDNFFIEVPPLNPPDYSSHNNDLVQELFDFKWKSKGTPLRSGLDRVGQYYSNKLSGKTNPITDSCQQNYSIVITDGYWDDADTLSSGVGDADGDGISKTLADVARFYYSNDISALKNQVPTNPWDSANWQHMVTFTVAYGLTGNLVAGANGWPDPPLAVNGNWGNPFTDEAAKGDDLWHAAFNSSGFFLGQQSPGQATAALSTILSNVAQRSTSAASVAQNSTVLNANSSIYQGTYDSNNWQGDVLAFPISINGVLSANASWSASCQLNGGACSNPAGNFTGIPSNNRNIITRNWTGANNGIAFRWPSNYTSFKVGSKLPTNLASFLNNAPYPASTRRGSQISANQNYGAALLNYLRGNRSQEAQSGGSYNFRDRNSILGDIVNSSPSYVPAPYRIYPDSLEASPYSAFKSTFANRDPMIYVGANDGMLHGFNANTGKEMIAYIPGDSQIYSNISNLSLPAYTHRFFVDGTPVEGDVYINGTWRTILSGNLRNGGQSIYALDITNPANFIENNAGQIYLWEFSDQDDKDMGYVHGDVTIAKVRTGTNQSKWAVIFGNGYNNTQSDGNASTNGRAALFILFIERGIGGNWTANSSYIKIPVGATNTITPNGLAKPYAVDMDGDFVVDYIYAGDLKGDLWKFDLRNTDPTKWAAATTKLFSAYNAAAGDQPITAPVIVGPHPTGLQNGVMVYFGTGKFLEPSDNSTSGQVTQTFYAIWDKLNGATVSKSKLLQQQIASEITPPAANATYRIVTSNPINWTGSSANLGWYLDLIVSGSGSNSGERQISQPILRNNNVIFTTMIPAVDPCSIGGSSWLMELDSATGGAPQLSPFDVNNDGTFTDDDYIDITINGKKTRLPVAGRKSTVGFTATPTVFLAPDKSSETKVLSGSQGLGTVKENPGTGPKGRQNWRQLY